MLKRPYQIEAEEAILENLNPDQPISIQIPTGGGKTLIGNSAVASLLPEGGSALWLAPSWVLTDQARIALARQHPEFRGGSRVRLNPRLRPADRQSLSRELHAT